MAWWRNLRASESLYGLYVPPGVAHGFAAVIELLLQYHVDAYFDGVDDELGFAWNDPDAAIPWPGEFPILSTRDRSNPSLADALIDAPTFTS